MRLLGIYTALLGITLFTTACSTADKAPDVTGNVRGALSGPELKDVSVSQDRDRGVVTLAGHVASEEDKARAGFLAKPVIGNQILANEITVEPPGAESEAKTVASDYDKAIEKNLDAALVLNHLQKDVKYRVSNSVITLTGDVETLSRRNDAQRIAANVPNVTQVVNELQIRRVKTTSQD